MQQVRDRKARRLRLAIGAGALGAIVAAFTLFAGVLPAAASAGSIKYHFPSSATTVTAGANANVTVSLNNYSASSSNNVEVCWELNGPGSTSFVHDSGSFTVSGNGNQSINLAVEPNGDVGQTPVLSINPNCGLNNDAATWDNTNSQTMTITIGAPPAGAPVIDSISPHQGPNGTAVTITLTAFATVTSVSFGATPVTVGGSPVKVFQVDAPAGNGLVDVSATNASGTTTLPGAYLYVPAVTSVSPSSGPVGQQVTIRGSNFTGTTGVTFGGTAAPASLQNDSTILATVPAGHSLGETVQVAVSTTSGTSDSNAPFDNFTYSAVAGPTITGVSGSCTLAGGSTIAVTGTAFALPATATIGGSPANIQVGDANSAVVFCPAQGSVGTYSLIISIGGQATNAFDVDYEAAAAPTVTSLDPDSGPLGGGNSVTVNGTNFQSSGLAVTFGSNTASCSSVTSTSMSCVAPAHVAGTVDVTVSVNSVASANTSADDYTYTGQPVVTSISPTSGATSTSVTVNGFNFTGTTAVKFGTTTVATSDVTINSDSKLTVIVPDSLTADDYDITVTTPSGTSATSDADVFTVTAGDVASLTLRGTFTLIGWVGKDGMPVGDALKGGASGPHDGTNDITSKVSVIWGFNTITQTFQGYFPSAANVPGANDLTTLSYGVGYFVGLTDPSAGTVTWKVEVGSPS